MTNDNDEEELLLRFFCNNTIGKCVITLPEIWDTREQDSPCITWILIKIKPDLFSNPSRYKNPARKSIFKAFFKRRNTIAVLDNPRCVQSRISKWGDSLQHKRTPLSGLARGILNSFNDAKWSLHKVWRIRSAAQDGPIQIDSRLERHLFSQAEVSSRGSKKWICPHIHSSQRKSSGLYVSAIWDNSKKEKTSPASSDTDIDV